MQQTSSPKFSIVIPTRERVDTLIHTLKTLVSQGYADCEIIVSDNCSADNTAEVVAAIQDDRISYIRTPHRMSMSDNWEFALGHCRGEFITYIGDDDGFMPDALAKINAFLKSHPCCDALVWDKIDYQWPSHIDESLKNTIYMYFPMDATYELSSSRVLNSVINFKEKYTRLPCIYNAFVRRSCIDQVRSLSSNGRFFNSISPDVYSGIALATVMERYCYTSYPLSVNGASGHSNGTSFTRASATVTDSPASKFMAEINVAYDDQVLIGPSPIICVMGEYLQARKYLKVSRGKLPQPSFEKYVHKLLQSALTMERGREIQNSAMHTAQRLGIKVTAVPLADFNSRGRANWGFQQGNGVLFFKAPAAVDNIYDACLMLEGMTPSGIAAMQGSLWRGEIIRYVLELKASTIKFLKWAYRTL